MVFLVLLSLVIILSLFLRDSLRYKITPNPTSKKVCQKLKSYLPKECQGPIYELGSGFGHMSIFFSKFYPQATIKSFEKAKLPFFIQKLWLSLKFYPRIELCYQDCLEANLDKAQIVFCYLYRSAMPRLAEKFRKEFRADSWLITHTFALDNIKPTRVVYADDLYQTPIYFYRR